MTIKTKIEPETIFPFTPVKYEEILRNTNNLNVLKASQQRDIQTKILIKNSEYFSCSFRGNINYCLEKSLLFLYDLKLGDVEPAFKNKSKFQRQL